MFDMFISILTDTYETVRRNPRLAPYDAELMDHMRKRWRSWARSLFGQNGT